MSNIDTLELSQAVTRTHPATIAILCRYERSPSLSASLNLKASQRYTVSQESIFHIDKISWSIAYQWITWHLPREQRSLSSVHRIDVLCSAFISLDNGGLSRCRTSWRRVVKDCSGLLSDSGFQILFAVDDQGEALTRVYVCMYMYLCHIPIVLIGLSVNELCALEMLLRVRLRSEDPYPILDQSLTVRGFLHDTKTGLLNEIKWIYGEIHSCTCTRLPLKVLQKWFSPASVWRVSSLALFKSNMNREYLLLVWNVSVSIRTYRVSAVSHQLIQAIIVWCSAVAKIERGPFCSQRRASSTDRETSKNELEPGARCLDSLASNKSLSKNQTQGILLFAWMNVDRKETHSDWWSKFKPCRSRIRLSIAHLLQIVIKNSYHHQIPLKICLLLFSVRCDRHVREKVG